MNSEKPETPKKVVDTDKCFSCPAALQKKERVLIFGKYKVDIPALLKRAITSINVDAYKTSDPFLCLNCYKRLIRFGKVKEQLELINAEIMKNYLLTREQQRWCKRLQNTNECNQQTVTSRKRSAFTQTLNLEQDEKPDFPSFTPIARINCTSSSYASPVSVVHKSPHQQSFICSTEGLQYSSTPIDPVFMRPKPSATPVKISVQYPSKKVNKNLSSEYEMLGKAIAHGPPSRIANAVMKCKPINKLVVEQVIRIVNKEVSALLEKESIVTSTSKKRGIDQFQLPFIMRRMGEKSFCFLRLSSSMQQY